LSILKLCHNKLIYSIYIIHTVHIVTIHISTNNYTYKIHFTTRKNSYMFWHRGAILRELKKGGEGEVQGQLVSLKFYHLITPPNMTHNTCSI